MLENISLNLPKEISCDRINLHQRCHKYDVQLSETIKKNLNFLQNYLDWPKHENSLELIEHATSIMLGLWDKGMQYSYVITDKNDVLLGAIDIANIHDFALEIGYWLAENATGNGYITEALSNLEKIIFNTSISQINLVCDISNSASVRVAQRCGYTKTVRLENDDIYTKSKN